MFNDIADANPLETHVALLDALPTADMAYVHVMLADAFSPQLNNAGDPQVLLRALRNHVKGSLIAAGNLTAESAQAHLDSGLLQLAVFGRPFIANPDLVERHEDGRAARDSSRGVVLHGGCGRLQRLSDAGGVILASPTAISSQDPARSTQ